MLFRRDVVLDLDLDLDLDLLLALAMNLSLELVMSAGARNAKLINLSSMDIVRASDQQRATNGPFSRRRPAC